eukprot:610331-Pelagomonas_calceolata.AAC.1
MLLDARTLLLPSSTAARPAELPQQKINYTQATGRVQEKKTYVGSEESLYQVRKGGHIRLNQAGAKTTENEDRSSNEEESKMIAERMEFQTFSSKQSQAQSACQPRKAMPID